MSQTDSEIKPGWKSSEFWLALFGSTMTLLNQSGLLGTPIPTDAVMTVGGILGTYILGRGVAKSAK